jgi:hypothetical protein
MADRAPRAVSVTLDGFQARNQLGAYRSEKSSFVGSLLPQENLAMNSNRPSQVAEEISNRNFFLV